MKAKVTYVWWDLFLSTLPYVDDEERHALKTYVDQGIEFLPCHGVGEPMEVTEPRVTGYISEAGLKQLSEGKKAIVHQHRDSFNNIPLYAGSTK